MKTLLGVVGVLLPVSAHAGGLLLPGSGAVSTMRAGAAVASVDDAEAIGLNPAGIAKSHGTIITIGISAISFNESFTRAGAYPTTMDPAVTYSGMPYPTMTNNAKPPLGFGSFQPVPVIGIVSDLGNRVGGLHLGFGIYAPNAYPFRDYNTVNGQPYFDASNPTQWKFDNSKVPGQPPPPTRYDILHQEAAIILPSVIAAYNIPKLDLDVGGRFSAGFATLRSTVALWGNPGNYSEYISGDGLFTVDATATGVVTGALGAAWRPARNLEVAFDYDFPIDIHAHGTAFSSNGPGVQLSAGVVPIIYPVTGNDPTTGQPLWRCADGGSMTLFKACVDLKIPQRATIAGRYKFRDERGREKGDLELDIGWENFGDHCDYINDDRCYDAGDYRVVVDAQVGTMTMPCTTGAAGCISLKDQKVSHGFQDVYTVRVGGSWSWPVGADRFIVRGGIGYDTAAAKSGWERLDIDGAARTMIAAGGSYKLTRWRFDLGFGYIYEGTRTQNRNCISTGQTGSLGCGPGGTQQDPYSRQGPDPLSPVVEPLSQLEHPVNQGTFTSSYVLVMLGAQYAF